MRILITGSSGHVGSAVAKALANKVDVVGLDLVPGPATTQVGNIADPQLVRRLIRNCDAVIHTAALHAPHLSTASRAAFRHLNVNATGQLLEAALAAGATRFIFTSTTSVYGCTSGVTTEAVWVTEELAPNAEDIYDETKLEAEQLCRQAANSRLTTVVLRMSRCFAEPEHLLAFYRMYRGVDVRDAAQAHWLAVTAALPAFSLFNISGPTPFRREDCPRLRTQPWEVIDQRLPWVRPSFKRRGWPMPCAIDRVYVIEKARHELRYQPKYGIRACLNFENA